MSEENGNEIVKSIERVQKWMPLKHILYTLLYPYIIFGKETFQTVVRKINNP